MLTVTKSKVVFVGRDKLVACMVRGKPRLTKLIVSEAVKDIGGFGTRGEIGAIHVDGMGWGFNNDSWRYILAVGEGEATEDLALEVDNATVEATGFLHVTVKFEHLLESSARYGTSILSHSETNLFTEWFYVFGGRRQSVQT